MPEIITSPSKTSTQKTLRFCTRGSRKLVNKVVDANTPRVTETLETLMA